MNISKGGVRKRGKRWYFYFNHNGKRIERVGGDTAQEARKALRKAQSNIDEGRVAVDSNIRISDLLDIWYKQYVLRNCRPSTSRSYKHLINIMKGKLGNCRLNSLNASRAQEFANWCVDNYSRGTANNLLVHLKSAIKYAITPLELISSSSALNAKLPRDLSKEEAKVETITTEEFEQILTHFDYLSYLHAALMIGFYTGMRAGEVCGLLWKNVNLNKGIIYVRHTAQRVEGKGVVLGNPKTKSSRRDIYIPETLVKYLKGLRINESKIKLKYGEFYKDNDFVIKNTKGNPFTPENLTTRIQHNLKDFRRLRFHTLRHTHATMLIEAGVPIIDVQRRLGHSKASTTLDVYSHATEDSQKRVANIIDAKIATK